MCLLYLEGTAYGTRQHSADSTALDSIQISRKMLNNYLDKVSHVFEVLRFGIPRVRRVIEETK